METPKHNDQVQRAAEARLPAAPQASSRTSNLAAAGIVSAMVGLILLQGLNLVKPGNGETAMAPLAAQPSLHGLLRGI
jgi:hypothetical protein